MYVNRIRCSHELKSICQENTAKQVGIIYKHICSMLDYFHSDKCMGGSLGKASESSSATYLFQLLTDLSCNFAMFVEFLYKVTQLYLP